MKNHWIFFSLFIFFNVSASSTVSDDYIKKQQELSSIAEQVVNQVRLVSEVNKHYESYRDKAISLFAGKDDSNATKVMADALTVELEKIWNQFKNETEKSLDSYNFEANFLSLNTTYKSFLKFYYIRLCYELMLMRTLLKKWEECAREVNQLSHTTIIY